MKPELHRFCETLLAALADLGPALADTAERLDADPGLGAAASALREAETRWQSLAAKLANQHAFLLIFGPLKSGKSTLMNAISGAYVSEVTALPGYPALVFVQHGEERRFSLTRYNGRESSFPDTHVLREVMADGHVALIEQIRAAELRGERFDPRRHFDEAVRRIDVHTPVRKLAESGTVLVDTPGLYSRMNFAYDVLAREFRDCAACAIFVVKTDNLFLEQIFTEFRELLDLFSRVFLVVNVDGRKRDLQPDGTLAPSAESAEPDRIVSAFRALAMQGALKTAYEEGRVRIHAVDLLRAASAALSGAAGASDPAFDFFQHDLTDYLNSSEYTRAFLRDSLRQSLALCDEALAALARPEVNALCARQDALAAEIVALDARLAAVDRLQRVDWSATFGSVRVENARRIVGVAGAATDTLRDSLTQALARWFDSDDGLKSLEQQYWNPVLRGAGVSLAEETVQHLSTALSAENAGATLTPEAANDLASAGVDLAPARRAARAALGITDTAEAIRVSVRAEAVPVRKSAGDWLLLRSAASVARRLFGEDRAQHIFPEVKRQRLEGAGRVALLQTIEGVLSVKFPDVPARSAVHLLEHAIGKFCESLQEEFQRRRADLLRERAARQEPFDAAAQIDDAQDALQARLRAVRTRLVALTEQEQLPGETVA